MLDTFLSNNTKETFLQRIKESLKECSAFYFSVSFIKKAGLILFEKDIEDCLKRGVKGRIITSTYQNFTDIPSLEVFKRWKEKYPNFDCHLEFESFNNSGFHTKGYIFEYSDSYEIIIGSSNITRFALINNVEWNISIKSKEKTNSNIDALKEYEYLWDNTLELNTDVINRYSLMLEYSTYRWDMDFFDPVNNIIRPNAMQRRALKELKRYRDLGVKKALVVSAMGSGKTYLAAFDARNFGANRVLFVVHRDTILSSAKDTFAAVFGTDKTYGLYNGEKQELGSDFVFASNIMLSKHLDEFDKNEFDYIVMDECHHAVTNSYKSIIEYFEPEFMLGLTATPERMDNQDVFELFDKNVPYELRLRDAIINEIVVPFHYYGIKDKLVDYSKDDASYIAKEITKEENVEFIISEMEKRKPDGKLKAIAFTSSISHAYKMADLFNDYGYTSIALTGNNDFGQRVKAFKDLQDNNNPLQIICAVDILNEGVDIPEVNMVLFLRPTESQTIFLQQLGRGLRKAEGKKYTTVLDFIGNNYNRSVQIAMALSTLGNSTIIEKPYMMELLRSDFKELSIPGVEINIDELAKEEIIDFVKNENFNKKEFLMKDYENFKIYLKSESYPSHMDFLNSDCAPDLMRLMKSKINGKKNKSYYCFLQKIGEESLPIFSNMQIELINKVSEYLPLVRKDEYLIIKQLLSDNHLNNNEIQNMDSRITSETIKNSLFFLNRDEIIINDSLNVDSIDNKFKEYLNDLLEYGLTRYDIEFGEYDTKFKLYGNYYKEQIQKIRLKTGTMYVKGTEFPDDDIPYFYVGLNKTGENKTSYDYKDMFINSKIFQWESVKDTTFESGDGPKLLQTQKVHLFIRKMEEEDGITLPFTYFGEGILINPRESTVDTLDSNGNIITHKTIMFDVELDNEVPKKYWFDYEIKEEKK